MTNLRRGMWLIPFVLLMWAVMVTAQDTSLTVGGSSIVAPIIQAVVPSDVTLDITTEGTAAGFAAFCQNQIEAVAASRALDAVEEAACTAAGVTFQEYLVGQNYLAVIGNPADTFNTCLTSATLNTVLQPSAAGSITNWTAVVAENPDLAISVYVPTTNTLDYATLDNAINGAGLRADAQSASPQDIIAAVAAVPGTLGIVPFQALSDVTTVSILPVDAGAGCVPPDASTFDAGVYTLGSNFYLYINSTAATKAAPLLNALADPASAAAIQALGYSAPSPASLERNRQSVTGEMTGRVFTRQVETFIIPTSLAGEVTLGGAPSLTQWLKAASDSFAQTQADLRFTLKFDGEPSGLRRFCNGELDMIAAAAALTGEAAANCEANGITTFDVPLGSKAVVIVANVLDTYAACLSTEQITQIWDASQQATMTGWNNVDGSFPEQSLTLFAPVTGDSADILMRREGQLTPPIRSDVEASDDPLYRAAAVANVSGALTFMTWSEYGQVLSNNQERIRLVSINNGGGCIVPSEETILDGTYPLTVTATLLVNRASLANINVQSYLWTLFDSQVYLPIFESLGFTGRSGDFFVDVRSQLLQAYAEAQAALIAAESTPEPGAELTPEATAEATAEASAETTPEATVEATAEATAEATLEATAEATAEATPAS